MKSISRFIVPGLARKIAILLALPFVIIPMISSSSPLQGHRLVWAQEQKSGEDLDLLYSFLQGHYSLLVRLPDSNKTYAGKVVLQKKGESLEVIRRINGKEIRGTGKIETATADRVKVLRVRFVDSGKNYEATYLIHSDLDNYARLTGYLYLKKARTTKPGLEALFMDR